MAQPLENILVARFSDPSKAYQALSVLKQAAAAGRVVLNQAGVVERSLDGRIRVPDGADNTTGTGMAAGSMVGMLVGVLGGPVGLLLGWGAGALIGGVFDIGRATPSETALAMLERTIAPGSTALIADVRELATAVLDEELVEKLGGQLVRHPTSEVLAEIEAAEEAARVATTHVERVMREQRKKERKERREDRIEALRAKLQRADEAIRSL